MKTKVFIILLFALFFLHSNITQAATNRVSDGALSGQISGAYNVDAAVTLYDVLFASGSFTQVFGDVSGLDAVSEQRALTLWQVLLAMFDGVFTERSSIAVLILSAACLALRRRRVAVLPV